MTVTAAAGPPRVEPAAVPDAVRRRLSSRVPERDRWSWVAAGVVTALAAILRLVDLDRPGRIIFDETYYAPHGYALLKYGVEWQLAEDGAHPVDGAPVFSDGPAYVVHPPLGKWLIGLGEWVFGYTPFGWRISAAVAGTLSVLMVARIGRRLFGSTVLGAAAGLLVALDGMHLVLSRTALLDIFLMFFVVAAFGALLLDRDARRRRWLRALENGLDPTRPGRAGRPPFDWRTGVPWWRLVAFALLGCATAVKWSAVFFAPVFLVLVVVWEAGTRRSAGVPRPWRDTYLHETLFLVGSVLVMPVVYLASWTGWLVTDHGYFRNWRADNGLDQLPVIGALQNLLHYHGRALSFHSGLDDPHQYESDPWQWLLLARPVAFHWSSDGDCGAARCASEVLLLGTPLLWWAFLPAIGVALWLGVARRDWRATAVLATAAAGIVPWFVLDLLGERVMFYFYALPSEPFLVLTVVYVLGALIGPPGRGGDWFGFERRTVGVVVAATYLLLVALNFAYFYPIYTGQDIPYEAWQARLWLGSRWY
ncbi:MAG: phospholipid carrier-dependent glycosyltransferase [Micromonosporaceae bacterium]